MPGKVAKKEDGGKVAEAPEKVSDTPADHRLVMGAQIDAETALRESRENALKVERTSVEPDAAGDIDERMAALLEDHIEMGARQG